MTGCCKVSDMGGAASKEEGKEAKGVQVSVDMRWGWKGGKEEERGEEEVEEVAARGMGWDGMGWDGME